MVKEGNSRKCGEANKMVSKTKKIITTLAMGVLLLLCINNTEYGELCL